MSAVAIQPVITPDDRLSLTVCVAIIVHTMFVLGVSFAPEPVPESRYESLEIILVAEKSDRAPEDADMLAQANLQGGGDAEQSDPPAAPIKAPIPAQTADIASAPAPPVQPTPAPAAEMAKPAPPAEASSETPADAAAEVEERVVQTTDEAELPKPNPLEEAPPEARPTEDQVADPTPPKPEIRSLPLPTAAQLLTRSFALASLNAELQQRLDSRAKRPRRKYISANTREYLYAAYMEAWRAKVERVGNINYPDEARRRQLSGALLLDVALNPDGSVQEITVRRSSGHKVLDDAAVRIVKLAAPFARFPPDILKEVDILHVTRTWKFLNSHQFSAR